MDVAILRSITSTCKESKEFEEIERAHSSLFRIYKSVISVCAFYTNIITKD